MARCSKHDIKYFPEFGEKCYKCTESKEIATKVKMLERSVSDMVNAKQSLICSVQSLTDSGATFGSTVGDIEQMLGSLCVHIRNIQLNIVEMSEDH